MRAKHQHSVRIPSLDGLRALAIALVLFGHSIEMHPPLYLKWTGAYAEFGVRIFFVLSGFLITTLLVEELEVTGRISLKKFYLRRVFRIFPASYTYILAIALLSASGVVALHARDLLHAVTYTANYDPNRSWYIGHLWSLSVEEQFYLLWPLTLFLAGRKRGMMIAALALAAAPAFRVVEMLLAPGAHFEIGVRFETAADSLATGCLLALLRGWLSARREYIRLLSSRLFVLVPIVTLLLVLPFYRLRWRFTLGYGLMNVGIALCLDWCMRNSTGAIGKVLNWRPVAFVGVLSYSLYLWQQPFLDRYSHSFLNRFPLSIALAFAAALASHYLVEKPFLRIKKRFESERVKTAVVASEMRQDQLSESRVAGKAAARVASTPAIASHDGGKDGAPPERDLPQTDEM